MPGVPKRCLLDYFFFALPPPSSHRHRSFKRNSSPVLSARLFGRPRIPYNILRGFSSGRCKGVKHPTNLRFGGFRSFFFSILSLRRLRILFPTVTGRRRRRNENVVGDYLNWFRWLWIISESQVAGPAETPGVSASRSISRVYCFVGRARAHAQ